MSIPSDFPEPVQKLTDMDDKNSPFLYDAVYSKKADPPSIRDGEFIAENTVVAAKLKALKKYMTEKCPDSVFSFTHFNNWGTTIYRLLLYVKPQTRDEIQKILQAAIEYKEPVKVGLGGAYHSWSPTYPDSGGLIINTCDLTLPSQNSDVQDDESDSEWTAAHIRLSKDKTKVTMVPGVTTGQLMQFFLANDVCFKADVILPSVTYGGVFSGGCHGVGKNETSMSDWITSMTIIDGNGDIKVIPDDYGSIGYNSQTILQAASASLGLFGIIVEITVKVEPMTNAHVINDFSKRLSLFQEQNKDELIQLLQTTESLEAFWFPFNSIWESLLQIDKGKFILKKGFPKTFETDSGQKIMYGSINEMYSCWNDKLWCREINFTSDKVTKDPGVSIESMILDVVTGEAMTVAKAVIQTLPQVVQLLLFPLSFKMLEWQYGKQEEEVVKVPWAIHYRDGIDLSYAYDVEFAFPLDINNPVALINAVDVVVKTTQRYAIEGLFFGRPNAFPLNLCMELRVMHKSKALLCPASLGDQEYILYIEVLSVVNTPGTKNYFEDICKKWKRQGGVPHWQKQWTFLDKDGSMIRYLQDKYGQNLTTFKGVRQAMNVDPNNMFVNNVYKAFLGV